MDFTPLKTKLPEPNALILITDGRNAEAVIYTPEALKKPFALDKYDTPNFQINTPGLQWAPLTLPEIPIATEYTGDSIFMFGKHLNKKFSEIPGSYFLWLKQQPWFLNERTPRNLGILNYILTIEEDAQVEKGIESAKFRRS